MKKVLLALSLLIGSLSIHAQAQYLGNYTQPAPNAAALGKYVDYPVSYYTGTPDISIPLYTLQDGAAKTSVSLSYHASGIRVAELASWVGLGWALNAGGMITRTVRGGPDDGVYYTNSATGGYYRDSGIRKMPLLPYPVNGTIPINNSPNSSEIRKTFLMDVSSGAADCEPDLFTFNFNGFGGKFVFDENKTPRLLTDADVKISVNFDGSIFTSWMITTPDGAKYFFGENSAYEINKITSNSAGQDNNTLKPMTWLLTRVVYPNSKDTLYLNYTPETYSYYDLGQESDTYLGTIPPIGNPLTTACNFSPYALPTNVYRTTVSGQRLTSIVSRNYKIVFGVNTAAGARQDMATGFTNSTYRLDSVKIYNSQNTCLKQFVLSYSYFVSTATNNVSSYIPSFTSSDASDRNRLKLLSVKEYSGDGTISKPPYLINYQETLQLPRRLDYDIDHWGYSNASGAGANNRFMPSVFHWACILNGTYGANRDPKWPDMQSYSIKSIKDPLGVLTSFDFEAHSSTLLTPSSMVGGLRIKKITTTDSLTGISNIRSFSYGNGGTLYKVPKYLFFPNNEYYYVSGSPDLGYRGYAFQNGMILDFAIRQSQSIVPLQDVQGNQIGYPGVKETFGPNGEGGYKIYSFMADQLTGGNSRLHQSNYTATAAISSTWYGGGAATGIYGNGSFNDILPQNLVYFGGFDIDGYYPAAPAQIDFRRGQLLREETYDSSGKLLRTVFNTYAQNFHEDSWIRGFKLFRSVIATSSNFGNGYDDAMTYYKLRTGISHLMSTTTQDFKDGKTFTSFTYYKYESPYHTQKTSDSTANSTGDIVVNKTYYSFDYANSATTDNVFGKLKIRNMVVPVATRTWKNNQLISGTVTLYKDFATAAPDTFLNPLKIYALETVTPLTIAQAGENVAFTTQFTTLLPDTYFVEKASFSVNGSTGKIVEQRLVNDKNQALVWDNNLLMPLAQTENAFYADVAYNSFESAETGNWTYAAGSVTADATAPTGVKAYSISGGISKSGLTSAKKYILSYWLKSGASANITGGSQSNAISGRVLNGWTFKQVTITGTTSISIGGSGNIDEVRLHPVDAQMTTYTYDALLRLIAQNSPNNTISYYEYDSLNRLVDIKDQYGNVLKAYEYNYGRSARPGN